ncbi:MAG: hypothetical protein RR933_06015 [Oscillospiraceae bacterium]
MLRCTANAGESAQAWLAREPKTRAVADALSWVCSQGLRSNLSVKPDFCDAVSDFEIPEPEAVLPTPNRIVPTQPPPLAAAWA